MTSPTPTPTPTLTPHASARHVLFLASVAAIGGFLFGFDSAVINGTIDALRASYGTNADGTGFAVGSALLGCAAGAFGAGSLAERLGRRPAMSIAAVVFLVSAIATGAATNVYLFVAARVLGGFAIGAASILAPMYISEVAPARLRGRLSSLQQLAIVLGLFFAFLSNYLIAAAAGGASKTFWLGAPAWRWMFWMEAIPSAAFLIGVAFIPESPRFLVARGRSDEARAVFARIGGDDADALVREVRASVRDEHKPRLSDLIDRDSGHISPVLWVGVGLALFQQFVGINVIFYYGEVLWKAAGLTSDEALQRNLISGGVNIASTFIAIALIDKVGRKPLLLFGSVGMVVTLGTMALIFARAGVDDKGNPMLSAQAGRIAFGAALLYIVAFGTSWGPVMWVLLGEMFPNRLRGAALAVSGAANWIANFAVTLTFPPLLAGAGLGSAYGLYAGAALLSGIFVFYAVQETKGKTLEQM
ncbi:MAG: sugar porter family MFS transporter [Phycisphaerae bacterium]|nr:sugar porter family MFS transporter [Phycisphaerae bacterium]